MKSKKNTREHSGFSKAFSIIGPSALAIFLFISVLFGIIIPAFDSALLDRKKELAREMTHVAENILAHFEAREREGQLSRSQAQQMAVDLIREIRYGIDNKDYFWINDMQPAMIMHPYRPDLDGKNLRDFADRQGKHLFVDFVDIVQESGAGFSSYLWQWKDNAERIAPKLSHVWGFEPWGWVVGTGIYLEDVQVEVSRITKRIFAMSAGILLVVLLLSLHIIRQGLLHSTKRHQAETELRRMHDTLQDLVGERTRDLAAANADLTTEIQERKRVEVALRESEERYRDLFENASDLIHIIDQNGKILYVNRAWRETLGYSEGEIAALTLWEIIAPEKRESFILAFKKLPEKKHSPLLETEILARDGKNIVIEGGCSYKFTGTMSTTIRCIFRDVSEKKKMEKELFRAQKIESIGLLAGGIAHDFNNLLTVILGYVNLAEMSLSPDDRIHKHLVSAEQAAIRAQGLTQQLLTFSRGGAPVRKIISIAEMLIESSSFVLSGSKIRCEYGIDPDLWHVDGDSGQLGQVIQNIVINGCQAMPDGGVIRINATNRTIGSDDSLALKPGKYVEISIRDQGHGISEHDLAKLFDPYFSTKNDGHGLGLTIAYSIMKKHDGLLTVDSMPGKGSTFFLYLPASEDKKSSISQAIEPVRKGRGRILLVDDEEVVRKVATSMLLHFGYTPDEACDGAEAVKLYQQAMAEGHPYDAVIMDLTIPGGMGGQEAVQKVLEIDSRARVIVSSGYANNPVMSDHKKYGFRGVIPKPYRAAELGRVVQNILQDGLEKESTN